MKFTQWSILVYWENIFPSILLRKWKYIPILFFRQSFLCFTDSLILSNSVAVVLTDSTPSLSFNRFYSLALELLNLPFKSSFFKAPCQFFFIFVVSAFTFSAWFQNAVAQLWNEPQLTLEYSIHAIQFQSINITIKSVIYETA